MNEPASGETTDNAPADLATVWLLAALAGAVDARGIALLHNVFLSFMSGNSTMFAVSLARSDWPQARLIGLVIATFVAGAAAGQVVAIVSGRWHLPVVIACVTALLLVPLFDHRVGIVALTFAMGGLNAAMQHVGRTSVSLTFVTGALVRFGQGVGTLLTGGGKGWDWLMQAVPWTGLVTGAALATLASMQTDAVIDRALPLLGAALTVLTAAAVRQVAVRAG
ncbi:YoaK family protein [Rhodopila sp.]|jgi:uncharacterized membrane protein YoaK (UPF0700 family)|uniref:YoaK family protein n=1 Tax=Rhodopila sp. TaxID=2480087 RepID=UPI002CA4AFB4|nr:DUF1275 family protein [Rhodopila sp.]HVZ10565.1 DUF1275 family protein [Rhodopila sp.]